MLHAKDRYEIESPRLFIQKSFFDDYYSNNGVAKSGKKHPKNLGQMCIKRI